MCKLECIFFSKFCNYWYQGKNVLHKFFVLIIQLKPFLLKIYINGVLVWDQTNKDIEKIQRNKKFNNLRQGQCNLIV